MGNQKETQKNPQYKYASTREKLCFGIGAIGKDAICNLVGAFLMLYFTDTLYLAPAFVGVLFFVARIWDAISPVEDAALPALRHSDEPGNHTCR